MLIIAKKAYRFARYKGRERIQTFDVQRSLVIDIPDWVLEDPMFKAAKACGNINILQTRKDSHMDVVDAVMAEAKSLGIANPGNMTLDQLQRAIEDARKLADGGNDTPPPVPDGGKLNDKEKDEDEDEDEDLEPITNKPLAEKSFKEMRAVAKERNIPVTRGMNAEGLRKLLADNGVV